MATATATETSSAPATSASLRLAAAARPPTSLPVANPTVSYWQAEASNSPIHDHGKNAALPSSHDVVDVVIIGSGISGAVSAYMLLEREGDGQASAGTSTNHTRKPPSVVMLEARRACSGATGRNGGHCRPDTFSGFARYAGIVGEEQAHKVLQNEWDTFELTEALCKSEDATTQEPIDCDWWRGQTLGVYRSKDVRAASQQTFERYKTYCGGKLRDGVRFVDDEQEARKISRVPDAVGAAVWPAGSLHPLRFVHGLLTRCLAKAEFQLFTHTPAESIARQDDGLWRIKSARGTITARTVLVATNGYSTKLVPELSDFLVPHRAQCSSISPPHAYKGPLALSMTASIINGVGDYEYLTQRPSRGGPNTPHQADREGDAIFILGGAHTAAPREEHVGTFDDSVVNDAMTQHLQSYAATAFADWEQDEGSMTHIWTGIQGYTRDSLPVVGEQSGKPGLFLNVGHHGHGMARASTCARGVARLVLAALEENSSTQASDRLSDEIWEQQTSLPSCYRWTKQRAERRDVDCRSDL